MAVDTQQIHGFDALAKKLRDIPQVLRQRVVRNALAAGARLVRDEARRTVPVLSAVARAPYRTPGTLQRAIVARTSKISRRAGDVGVFVNVRPAKGAKYRTQTTRLLGVKVKRRTLVRASQRGAKSKTDPFYWRFVEFGTSKMRARPFLRAGATRLPDALQLFTTRLGAWFRKTNQTGQVQP